MTTDKITIYTPESPLRHPILLLISMWRDVLSARGLAWRLFVRDLSAAYRKSLLGYLWAFIPPVVTTVSFTFLSSQGVVNAADTGVPYTAYVMIGTLFWQIFVDALNCPLKAVMGGKAMLAKINFPREALILAGLGEVVFNFLIRILLLIPLFLYYQIPLHASSALVPLGMIAMMVLGLAVGLLLLPVAMMFNDIAKGLPLVTNFLMILTPVVYAPTRTGIGAVISQWNPVAPLLTTSREWLLGMTPTFLPQFLLIAGVSLVAFFIGWLLFRVTMPIIIERMGG